VEVRILGRVSVIDDDGSSVVVRSAQQRLVLAVLTAARGRTVAADVLAESLWADDLPADPSGALQSHVSRLRRQLGPSAPWIETTVNGYRFAPPSEAIDASRFETLLDDARELTDDTSAAVDRLDAALALWRGRAYGEFAHHPAVAAEATRLEELRAQAAELLLRCARSSTSIPSASAPSPS
jgi:DNA-binding SARP family transcriptional activator